MTNNELTLEQLEDAIDNEMKTSEMITKIVKKSFEEERKRSQPTKIVKIICQSYFKIKKKSAA